MRLPVCLFVLILGGFLGIVTETGALDAGIAALVKKLKGNELVLIPILMFIFSIGGTTYGMCEETVPFYLLLAATMVAAGFDSVVGAAVVLSGRRLRRARLDGQPVRGRRGGRLAALAAASSSTRAPSSCSAWCCGS